MDPNNFSQDELSNNLEHDSFIYDVHESVNENIRKKLANMLKELNLKPGNEIKSNELFEHISKLYTCLLANIIFVEHNNKPNINVEVFLKLDALKTTLLVCCVEIVLNLTKISETKEKEFPWSLNYFEIDCLSFMRIIELVIARHEKILRRSSVKHLKYIEECCLESLAWNSPSKIWEILSPHFKTLLRWTDVENNNGQKISDERKIWFTIFLRKFYKLAWFRIKKLCKELNMGNDIHLNKIWTLFEHLVTEFTYILRDRHLDEMIMSTIYIYIRVAEVKNTNFPSIIEAYKKTPNCNKIIYREVLLKSETINETSQYHDVIIFSNTIYEPYIEPFALRFSKTVNKINPILSPHPSDIRIGKPKTELSFNSFVNGAGKIEDKELQVITNDVKRGKRKLSFSDDHLEDGTSNVKYSSSYFSSVADMIQDRCHAAQ